MAGTSVASILSDYHISLSQEEVLANIGGGWERNGHFSLDETPSQNLLSSSPTGAQQNLLNLNTRPPSSCEGDSGSESSESVDGDADMGFTQEPVEWISPSSSPEAIVGAEGDDGGAEGNDEVAKEDSYDAAFESDRSQSPSQDWPNPQVQTPNLGMSAEFFTQPALGVMDFQLTPSEDLEHEILRRETIPEAESQVLPGRSLLLLPPIPENAVSVVEAPVLAGESCIQPFTQPAFETQPFESQPFESLNKIQELANQMQLAEGRNEVVHNPTLLDKEMADIEEPQPMQQGSGRDELVKDAPAVNNNNGHTEQTPQERGEDELSSDSQLPIDDGSRLRSTEHKQQEHGSCEIPRDIPHVDIHRGGSGLLENAQPLTRRGNGDTKSPSERVDCAEELHGQQKRQRVEASPVRARRFPKTVMDVIRSRSRSLSNSLVDDECNILSIIMRAGVKMSLQAKIPSPGSEFHAFVRESTTANM